MPSFLIIFIFIAFAASRRHGKRLRFEYEIPSTYTVISDYSDKILNVPLPSTLHKIFWLHIQKTATSFGMALFLHACPAVFDKIDISKLTGAPIWEGKETNYSAHNLMRKKECKIPLITGRVLGFGSHIPYHNRFLGMNHSVVALFRHPVKRVISAFLFRDDDVEIMVPTGFARNRVAQNPPNFNMTKEADRFRSYVKRQPNPIVAYADPPFIRSAMTKMVLGYNSGFNITLTDEELAEAKRRVVHDFAFIGLTEEYNASLTLFHKQFGVSHPNVKGYEYIYMRKNNISTSYVQRKLGKQLREAKYIDKFDDELYDLVARIFYSRCEYFKVITAMNHSQLMKVENWR